MAVYALALRAVRTLHDSRGWGSLEIHLHLPAQGRKRSPDLLFGGQFGTLPLFLEGRALGVLDAAGALMALARQGRSVRCSPWRGSKIVACFAACDNLTKEVFFTGAAVENICTVPSVRTPPGLGLFSRIIPEKSVTISWCSGNLTEDELASVRISGLNDLAA